VDIVLGSIQTSRSNGTGHDLDVDMLRVPRDEAKSNHAFVNVV